MPETETPPILPRLTEIARLDVLINGIKAQLLVLDSDLAARKQSIAQSEAKRGVRTKLLDDKKSAVSREEKSIKLEREKINERRNALMTLSNYKLQQAAEREIEFVSKQIGKREDLLLSVMREVELLEKEIAEFDAGAESLRAELAGFEKEAVESSQTLKTRMADYSAERVEQMKGLEGNPALIHYNRVVTRYPKDPVVPMANRDSCSGCHVRVGPQVLVQVSRGELVKCQGCGRILTLPVEQAA